MTGSLSADDLALLDTNKNGVLDAGDDPYSPYYPGDDMVDWVGYSIYHYGTNFPWQDNVVPVLGKFEGFINSGNFYRDYAVRKGKPMLVAETGSTFHVRYVNGGSIPPGPGELAIKQGWWRQFLTNQTFLSNYPKIKMFCLFEFAKDEELTFRDWRIAHDPAILRAFQEDFKGVAGLYLYANGTQLVGSAGGNTFGSSGFKSVDTSYIFSMVFAVLASVVFLLK